MNSHKRSNPFFECSACTQNNRQASGAILVPEGSIVIGSSAVFNALPEHKTGRELLYTMLTHDLLPEVPLPFGHPYVYQDFTSFKFIGSQSVIKDDKIIG